MNYQQAVAAYRQNPVKEVLHQQVQKLTDAMTLKEKIFMLSGHPLAQVQKDMITTGRNYNVHALPASGCKRLGVPPVLFTDGPRGVVMLNSTCFPSAVARASTFDPDVEYRVGKVIADEAIAQGANLFAGVCINVARNPRWGRTQESYGEDPFLLGEMGKALTVAVQEEGMIACVKHFALNSMEDLRFYIDVHIDDRALHEIYLPHFKKCVDAGAQCVMSAYNRYEEYHCGENKKLLTDILRREWDFDGFVMSDFVWGTYNCEHSLRAGLDCEMMFTMKYTEGNIKKCLSKGLLNMEHIDRAAQNILKALIRQEPNIKPRDKRVVASEHSRAVALEAAQKGMVLLENNGILPLSPNAGLIVCGNYADVVNTGDHGSSRVWDKKIITPYQGLKKVFPNTILAGAKDGKKEPITVPNSEAVRAKGDVAVVCAGFDYKTEGEYFANMNYKLTEKPHNGGGDRLTLRLSNEEVELIKGLKKAGKKVIVCLFSGSAVLIDEWKEYADAVIMHYYGGCEGGTALADLLSGKVNFSGKLPFTVAQHEDDYPEFKYIGQHPYTIDYGYYHGYAKLDKERKAAAYPFGYGLSYTTFQVSDAQVSECDHSLTVTATVKNTGEVAGAEVVQVYVGSKGAANGDDRPVKQMKGFRRVELDPGQQKVVQIVVPKEELKFWTPNGWVLDDAYTVYVGTNCANAAQV
jgi:beta-glucosidase